MKSKSPPFHSSTAAAAAAETEKAINIYKEQTAAVAHTKIATKLKEERERGRDDINNRYSFDEGRRLTRLAVCVCVVGLIDAPLIFLISNCIISPTPNCELLLILR